MRIGIVGSGFMGAKLGTIFAGRGPAPAHRFERHRERARP